MREHLEALKKWLDAFSTVCAFAGIGDEDEIPTWPSHGIRDPEFFKDYPKLTVGAAHEIKAVLNECESIKEENERLKEQVDLLKSRVSELERKEKINFTLSEVSDLCNLVGLTKDPLDIMPAKGDEDIEICICQDVTLDNEDGTHTKWPLAFYWVDCPEEGFTGIGDDPGSKQDDPANE